MLALPEVTVWTMVWNDDRQWIHKAGQVLRYCNTILKPARFVLFAHEKIPPRDYPFEIIQIPQLNWQSYNLYLNRVVPTFIGTKFAMSVHEDGFPLDVSLWQSAFLDYDYIGAPWDDGQVGNGGFNIESRKLMDLKCAMPVLNDEFTLPSDRLVCTARKAHLEERGVRFAPRDLALAFSTEQTGGNRPSFGFHGRAVSADKYRQGWAQIAASRSDQGFTKEGNKAVPPVRPAVPAPRVIDGHVVPSFDPPAIDLVYVHVLGSQDYRQKAERFVKSYVAHPPGYEHTTTILCNLGKPTPETEALFAPLPNKTYFLHDNTGWDIGGYLALARSGKKCDLMFCCASSCYVRKPGWLKRIAEAYVKFGPGMYGTLGTYEVAPHFCTTGFAASPSLFRAYPRPVLTKADRYNFEHGHSSMVRLALLRKIPAMLVTWDGEYEWRSWRRPPNVYVKGDQSNCMTYFVHSDSYEKGDAREKIRRQGLADRLYNPQFVLR